MQLSGLSYTSAPQVTGHPHALPAANDTAADVQKIKPILDARNPETQLGSNRSPSSFWHAAQGEPDPRKHSAPPSIMQIKISRMLNDQASEQAARAEAETTQDPDGILTDSTEDTAAIKRDTLFKPDAAAASFVPYPMREPEFGEPDTALVLPELPEPPTPFEPAESAAKPPAVSSFPAYEEAASASRGDRVRT